MSFTDVLVRSLSGYVFLLPLLFVYFWSLKKSGKQQTGGHIFTVFLFCYYLIGVFTMTGIGKLNAFTPELTLVPFVSMISGPVDTVLNVVLFIPFGFFLPLLYRKYDAPGKIVLSGFLFSLLIEIVQMFGRGSTDINDLITNTLGACLGFLLYRCLSKMVPKTICRQIRARNTSATFEVLLCITCSLVMMVSVQPLVISSLFHLG